MIKKILNSNWKGILTVLNDMSKRSKRLRIDLFIDMYNMYKKYGYTWLNYYTYNFDRVKNLEIRRTFLSQYGDNSKIYREFIKSPEIKYMQDKIQFNKKFTEFLGREIINLEDSNLDEFKSFIQRNSIFFAKDPVLMGGKGVERVVYSENDSVDKLYESLLSDGKIILEQSVIQHPEMKKLSLNSLNTVRIGTAIDKDGNISILYNVLRVSGNDSYLDNASQGGYWTLLNENGVIDKPLYRDLPKEDIIEINPITKFNYIGFKIPYFEKVKELAIQAASLCKDLKYVGWDIAITENGPILIEGNDFPTTELYQAHVHMEDGKGKVKLFEEKLGIKLR